MTRMTRFMHCSIRRLALAILTCIAMPAVSQTGTAPRDLSQWDLTCFCSIADDSPQALIHADNNGQILYYARSGMTRSQLEQAAGRPIPISQLQALVDWNLLRKEGEVYTTAIPLLDANQTSELRARMRAAAARIEPELVPEVRKISVQLEREGHSAQLYSIVFSYVLDGLTWKDLNASHALATPKLSIEHPFWDGTFWATYPARSFRVGTNANEPDPGSGIEAQITWTKPVLDRVHDLERAKGLRDVLHRAAAGNCKGLSVEDEKQEVWKLGSDDGRCAFPVIREDAGSPINAAGRRMASEIAETVRGNDVRDLIGGGVTAEQAHVIETHELIWEVLDLLEHDHSIIRPAALDSGGSTDDVLGLFFVTIRKR